MIHHKPNSNFNNHIIHVGTQEGLIITLLDLLKVPTKNLIGNNLSHLSSLLVGLLLQQMGLI
jgi:hypothetical protein